jgi:hypothetical protein
MKLKSIKPQSDQRASFSITSDAGTPVGHLIKGAGQLWRYVPSAVYSPFVAALSRRAFAHYSDAWVAIDAIIDDPKAPHPNRRQCDNEWAAREALAAFFVARDGFCEPGHGETDCAWRVWPGERGFDHGVRIKGETFRIYGEN